MVKINFGRNCSFASAVFGQKEVSIENVAQRKFSPSYDDNSDLLGLKRGKLMQAKRGCGE